MKKSILFFNAVILAALLFLILLPAKTVYASESSGTCGDNLTWSLTEGGTLTISGTGAMYDYDSSYPYTNRAPWITSNSNTTIKTVLIQLGVTSIGEYAFSNCNNLSTILIPDSVTNIGVCAFRSCSKLSSITIPDSVTNIGEEAFEYCSRLSDITIPNSVTNIGPRTFSNCDNLSSITFGDSLTSIGVQAFWNCKKLSSIALPNSLTSIGTSAFDGCSRLTSVTFGDSLTSIGEQAFWGCSSLTNITIPNSVTFIGGDAFMNCNKLTSITFGDSLTSIETATFDGCISLNDITLPDSLTSIGSRAFNNCRNLSNIIIPNSVTHISTNAFQGCTSLGSIVLPNSLTLIAPYAFCNCSSLSSITIPNSVTTIGYYAFSYCSSLEKVSIPATCTQIEKNAFLNCQITDVCFGGTRAQWDAITIESGNEPLTNATIHYEAYDVYPQRITSINVTSVSLDKDSLSLSVGETATLVATITPDNADNKNVSWQSNNSSVASVSSDGVVTGLSSGTANITVTTEDQQKTAVCTVTVTETAISDPVEAFVSRMYTIILDREPEPAGLQDWTTKLKNREIDGASFSNGIVMSQEYTNKNDSDETYVNKLYRTFLNREADEGGFNGWVAQLKQGYSRKYILAGFVNSEEFTQICASYGIDRGTLTLTEEESARSDDNLHIDTDQVKAYVTRLYDKILERQPDEEGFNNWVNAITSRQQNAAVVAKIGFFESQEYANKNRTNEEFVTDCYRSLMGREPDEAGFADWTGRLNRGEMSRAEVIETGFGQSQEFANILRQYGLKMAE